MARPRTFAVLLVCIMVAVCASAQQQSNAVVALYSSASTPIANATYAGYFSNFTVMGTVQGLMVPMNATESCNSSITLTNAIPTQRWIAVVDRGNCTFVTKTIEAIKRGASGMILVDIASNNSVVVMGGSGSFSLFVAVSISHDDGQDILQAYSNNQSTIVRIAPTGVLPDDPSVMDYTRIAILIFMAVFVVLVIAVYLHSCFKKARYDRTMQQRREQEQARQEELREVVVARVESFPIIPYQKPAKSEDADVCAVCLEEFSVGVEVRQLPCKHVFHVPCIDPWLREKHTCPLCKMDIVAIRDVVPPSPPQTTVPTGGQEPDVNETRFLGLATTTPSRPATATPSRPAASSSTIASVTRRTVSTSSIAGTSSNNSSSTNLAVPRTSSSSAWSASTSAASTSAASVSAASTSAASTYAASVSAASVSTDSTSVNGPSATASASSTS